MKRSPFPEIAVIGYGCRLPGGVATGQGFWDFLRSGRDAVSEIPADRWNIDAHWSDQPGIAGKTAARWGGFLDRIDEFEPECFGISPREAVFVDPQQRLLLETTWDALEMAGLPVPRLAGSRTGVFVGISNVDYGHLQSLPTVHRALGAFTATGSSPSIAANRLSYCLDLRGPSIALDTACSSSLVALDVAVTHLRTGEVDMAIAGGANVIILPDTFIMFSAASMLSPDGRCKAFDASANGFVRGEGAGVVILKRLEDARRDEDPIQAVILGSGSNQDGRTAGISLPNVDAQESLLREVYERAGIALERMAYIEAHGTGTAAGDPAEAEALGRVFAESHSNGTPLYIGSVKTNIGHLEPASGIASIIKSILMIQHRQIPPSLHFRAPNPAIDFDGWRLRVPTTLLCWPNDQPAMIGVNSFGFGGANAHVVLGEFCANQRTSGRGLRPQASRTLSGVNPEKYYPLLLTARSSEALHALAQSWLEFIDEENARDADLSNIAFSTLCRRTRFRHRLGFAAKDVGEARAIIQSFVDGERGQDVYVAEGGRRRPQVAFVFCGQGAHWYGMGRQLLQQEPVFRNVVEQCDAVVRPIVGWSVIDEIQSGGGDGRLERTSIAQLLLFAIQAGLDGLWRSWGVQPDFVVGHSAGELAAARASGALSIEAAARIMAYRGICLEEYARPGRMIAAALSEHDAACLLGECPETIAIAAVNSPQLVTLSGDASAIDRAGGVLDARRVWWKPLAVQVAFHTPLVDPAREPFLEAIRDVAPRDFAVPFISTVTGKPMERRGLGSEYWWDNMRRPVRFSDAVQELIGLGAQIFLEVGPHPVLSGSIRQCVRQSALPIAVLPSLRREQNEGRTLRSSLAGLYANAVEGVPAALWPEGGRCVELPSHPWARQRYWHECGPIRQARIAQDYHPLLGRRALAGGLLWQSALDTADMRWLRDHAAGGQILFPAAGFVETALAAAARALGGNTCTIDDFVIRRGLFFATASAHSLQTSVDDASSSIAIASRVAASESDDDWIPHVEAAFRPLSSGGGQGHLTPQNRKQDAHARISGTDCYRRFKEMGLDYGPAFQSIVELYQGRGWALGFIQTPEETAESLAWHVHPTLLDGCFQALLGALPDDAVPEGYVALPERIERIDFRRRPGARAWCEARLTNLSGGRVVGDIRVFRADGEPALDIVGFRCQAVPRVRYREATPIEKCLLVTHWRHKPLPNSPTIAVPLDDFDLDKVVRAADAAGERPGHDATSQWIEDGHRCSNRLTLAYIAQGLRALGFELRAGECIDVDALIGSGKLIERLRPHFERCARWLFESQAAGECGASPWRLSRTIEAEDPDRVWAEALAVHPEWYRQFRLIELCGCALETVWSGAIDPLELLFSSECLGLLENIYLDSMPSRKTNQFFQRFVAHHIAAITANRPIQILEIGAGTAGTALWVAPVLPPRRSEYWFTDVSPVFIRRAEEKMRRYPFVRYHTLDIERPLADQDIPERQFDIVIAAHVLHATRGVEAAMRRCRSALVDGGVLLAAETCATPPSLDLIFGMTVGWWYFRDDPARPDGPHLPRDKWLSIMERAGFESCRASGEEPDRQIVLVGRNPRRARQFAFPPPAGEALPPEKNWIIFADESGHAGPLIAGMRERGLRCIEVRRGGPDKPQEEDRIHVDPDDEQAVGRVLDRCRAILAGDYAIVYMWSLDIPAGDAASEAEIDAAETLSCHCAMDVLRVVGGEGEHAPRRFMFVTCGARSLSTKEDPEAFLQSPLLGLARVAANEFAALKIRLIDLDPANELPADILWAEIVADDKEEEVAWRGPHRFIPRLEFNGPEAPNDPVPGIEDPVPFKLAVRQLGNLNSLELRETNPAPPGPGEIQIDVHWAALNFRDVLRALSRDEIAEHVELGMESAGIVCAVGESVSEFQAGDRVVCCGNGCIASRLTVRAECAAKVPHGMSMLAAVSMPVAFLTADYALREVGRLRKGERVLIHSAAGGVGLAAIQLAGREDADIYATASSRFKRELLQKFGVKRIMNSRTLDFADEIRNATNGEGVDVVLNSLAGQAMVRSLAALRPFGRFLELGKRDFLENTKIGLWPLRNNVSYHAIDVSPFLSGPPDAGVVTIREIMAMAAQGVLSPLPVEVFPVARATDAFRFMAQGAHAGKVVLDMTQHLQQVHRFPRPVQVRSDATYLITGGLGGIGLVVARWLADSGAKHLMVVSRTGPQSEVARLLAEEMEQRGVEARIRQCDVGELGQLQAVFSEIKDQMPALAGVFHLAMVLDDGAIMNMDRARFRAVMHPKFRGAINLHRLCRSLPLDWFVLFSSASASVGFAGQSNYAAANAGLESLAHFRRANALPACAIAWGVLGDAGYAAARPEILQHLRQNGYYEIGLADFRKALGLALASNEPVQGVARADWHMEVRKLRARGNRQTLLSALADVQDTDPAVAPELAREAILAAAPEQRAKLVHDLIRDLMAAVLGTGADRILSDKPLTELGFDSLMAIELAGQVESQTGVMLPLRSLGDDVTLAKLSELLAKKIT